MFFNPDYALGVLLLVYLCGLCVRLRDLRVKNWLNRRPEHFNAESGEEDAEFAEEKLVLPDKNL